MQISGEKALTWSSKSGLDKLTDKFLINNTTWKRQQRVHYLQVAIAFFYHGISHFETNMDGWTTSMALKINKKKTWPCTHIVVVGTFSHGEPPGFKLRSPYQSSLIASWNGRLPKKVQTNYMEAELEFIQHKRCVHRYPFLSA